MATKLDIYLAAMAVACAPAACVGADEAAARPDIDAEARDAEQKPDRGTGADDASPPDVSLDGTRSDGGAADGDRSRGDVRDADIDVTPSDAGAVDADAADRREAAVADGPEGDAVPPIVDIERP